MGERNYILVTGGAGYIGSHTAVELMASGFDVLVADNLSNSHEEVIGRIGEIAGRTPVFEKVDLCDKASTDALFDAYGISAVIHFAALKAVGESVEQPLRYYRNNLLSLINVLGACGRTGVESFVFSSSCTVYGQPDSLPVGETAPVKEAESPYGSTKKMSEEILADATRQNTLRAVSLRYFNPVGAHHSALIGEYPIGKPSNLMPVITRVAAGKLPGLEVFGDDYPTPDGTCIRDYIHVMDVAAAHVVALERLLKREGQPFEVYNLGTGKGHSVLEMVHAFRDRTGVDIAYTIGPRRPGDIEQVWADVGKIRKVMGWKAQYGLGEMIDTAWQWEQALETLEPGISRGGGE